jgi:hypothetical protein
LHLKCMIEIYLSAIHTTYRESVVLDLLLQLLGLLQIKQDFLWP